MNSGVAASVDARDDRLPTESNGSHRGPRWLPRVLWTSSLLFIGIGLFTLYLRQSRIAPFNSDGASNVLQANAMLHGNLLLGGWWTSDVSFYTTELPEYMFVEVLRGLRPDVVHFSGALAYTLTVLLVGLLARGKATGPAGAIRALLAGGIMLAPGISGGTEVFLENPDHAGTAVPVLVLLLLLDRAPERWYVPVVVCGLLAWIEVADQLTLVAATAPVAAVTAIRLLMPAMRRRRSREFRYNALLLAAAVLSTGVASLADEMIRRLGGFDLNPLGYGLLAPVSHVPANARMMGETLMLLFGANYPGTSHQPLGIIAQYHLIGLALAVLGFVVGAATFFTSRTDRVTQIIVTAAAAILAAGIFGTVLPSLAHAHEVAILLPFGAVLAGRTLPPLVPVRWQRGRESVVAVLAAWLAAGLAALCFAATWAPMASPTQALANWLADHHYTEGLAGYWQANITTVTSGGGVLVAPIAGLGTKAPVVQRWESSASWYEPSLRRANFVIAMAHPSVGQGSVSKAAVRYSFGAPAHQYQIGQYVVMVYNYNLLTRLSGRAFPGTS
jgi:hypothetical protein